MSRFLDAGVEVGQVGYALFELWEAIGDEAGNVVHLREIQLRLHLEVFRQKSPVDVAEKDVEGLPFGLGHVDAIGERLFHAGSKHLLEIWQSRAQDRLVSFYFAIGENESHIGIDLRNVQLDQVG